MYTYDIYNRGGIPIAGDHRAYKQKWLQPNPQPVKGTGYGFANWVHTQTLLMHSMPMLQR